MASGPRTASTLSSFDDSSEIPPAGYVAIKIARRGRQLQAASNPRFLPSACPGPDVGTGPYDRQASGGKASTPGPGWALLRPRRRPEKLAASPVSSVTPKRPPPAGMSDPPAGG